MSDNYGPHQGPGGWQPQDQDPQGWQPKDQNPQGWQPQAPQNPSTPQGYQADGYQPAEQGYQQQGYQQQGYQQPAQGWQQQGPQGPVGWQPQGGQPPKKKNNLGVIITAAVVVVALAVGITVWLVSRKSSETASGGQATPEAAANTMLSSLTSKDPVGIAEQLDPTEAQVFTDMSGDILSELKRLQIVNSDASAQTLSGSNVTIKDLKFDASKAETVNDHVTIEMLTAGTITLTSDPSKLPFTDKIKKALGPQLSQAQVADKTVNIANEVAKMGHPIRIATVKRGDKWYPSLFYTLADNWLQDAQKSNPGLKSKALAAPITAIGGSSPEDAVNGMLNKAMGGDYEGVIGMLPPDEMGVLYDYGKRILAAGNVKSGSAANMPKISNLKFTTSDVTGGKKVSLQSATVETGGQTVSVAIDAAAGKLTIDAGGKTTVVTPDTAMQMMGSSGGMGNVPPQVADIVKREFKQLLTIGIVTTQVNGKWYVSPLRTYSGVLLTLLKGLQPGDIDYLLQMAGK
ncbi:MAG: hypothetical protein M3Y77_06805 [Actinomycetota bacterium]|nr:hypothetical protein [Actinomycetota bacterium]